MIEFAAHFDGRVIVPDNPIDLPLNQSFVVQVQPKANTTLCEAVPASALIWLAENAVDDELPADLSLQHDHYLYGMPKRSWFCGPIFRRHRFLDCAFPPQRPVPSDRIKLAEASIG